MKDIVIIEGPTAAGKSTLLKAIGAELALTEPIHFPAWDKSIAFDAGELETRYGVALKPPVVMDRWIYSNGAYAAVFNNQARVPHYHLETLAKGLGNPVVIFLHATPGVLYSRIHGRDKPQMPKGVGDMKNLIRLVDRFAQEEQNCGLPKVGIRSHDEDLDSGASLRKALKAIRS